MNSQCRLAHMATPIQYLAKPSYRNNNKLRRMVDSSHGRLATLNQVVRGWYCGQLEVNTDLVSQYTEVSTLGEVQTTTESVATQTLSSDETAATETQPAENNNEDNHFDEKPQPDFQPAPSVDRPSSPTVSQPVNPGQGEAGPPAGEDCEWIDDYGNCCDPSEGVYYRPRLQRRLRRSQFVEIEQEEVSTNMTSAAQVITYTQPTTTASRPLTTFFPMEAPNMPIIEAIYIVLDTYENQSDRIPLGEATRSHTILPYTDTLKQTSGTAKPTATQSHPYRPTTSKGLDPNAGMKAGIAIGILVVLGLVVFVFFYCRRSLRRANQARLERDAQPGPTRGWST